MTAAHGAAPAQAAEQRILEQAANWFAVLGSPSATAADRQRWQAWCDADARHRDAWQRVDAISAAFDRLPSRDRADAHQTLAAATRRQAARRRAAKLLFATGSGGILAWLLAEQQGLAPWSADFRTATGERRRVELADGAQIWLNTDSAVDVHYGADQRRLDLRRGEILVTTAADRVEPARPFVVETAQGVIRALGTRFAVRLQDDATRVDVFDGRVELWPRSVGAPRSLLAAGQRGQLTATTVSAPGPAEAAREAWRDGLLLANDVRLGDLIADLARYRRGHLGCTAAVADLRVVGAYDLADTDRVLAAIEATLPVRVRCLLPWWVVVDARSS